MKYDIKIYEEGEEQETIRDLKYSQKEAIVSVLTRHKIMFQVKEIGENKKKDLDTILQEVLETAPSIEGYTWMALGTFRGTWDSRTF